MSKREELFNRIKKNEKKRASLVKQLSLEAYRLYDKDIPAYPYIIDRYGEYFFVYEKGRRDIDVVISAEHFGEIQTILHEQYGTPLNQILLKKREEKRGKTQYDKLTDFHSGNADKEIIIAEGKIKFIIKLHDYLDVGLFLDHRPMRAKIKKMSHRKWFLNLFSYTSSVSVYAALGGAHTISVDKSKKYIEWSKRNFELNNIKGPHEFIAEDSITYLKECREKFDIIFVDPPTFSNEKKKQLVFEVENDQEELVKLAMRRLSPKGILFFSTNKRSFKVSEKLKEQFLFVDLTKKTIPFDFDDKKIHYCFQFQHKE